MQRSSHSCVKIQISSIEKLMENQNGHGGGQRIPRKSQMTQTTALPASIPQSFTQGTQLNRPQPPSRDEITSSLDPITSNSIIVGLSPSNSQKEEVTLGQPHSFYPQ